MCKGLRASLGGQERGVSQDDAVLQDAKKQQAADINALAETGRAWQNGHERKVFARDAASQEGRSSMRSTSIV
jgi:hypothetical protein